jgi:uncharacterized protein YceK
MKIIKPLFLIVLIILLMAGCASIVSKSQYPVKISSQPQEAEITIVNKSGETVFTGKTPTTVTLKAGAGYFKGENYTVTFKKEGFPSHTTQIVRELDGWYLLGNILIGGLIGWFIVDPITGAMWTLEDLNVDFTTQSSSLQMERLYITTLEDVPDHLRSKMIRIN